jgi:hypothetical protein
VKLKFTEMATVEDVYWLYENEGKLNDDNVLLFPNVIGETGTKCSFKRKTYIIPGQECPVCMDPILRKSEAYLTSCGHGFHKKCIFDAFHAKVENDWCCQYKCPMCRANIGDICIQEKYNSGSKEYNKLDALENFWMQKEFMMCVLCNSDFEHYEGMKSDCHACLKYVKYG